jgi:hypothetical protein
VTAPEAMTARRVARARHGPSACPPATNACAASSIKAAYRTRLRGMIEPEAAACAFALDAFRALPAGTRRGWVREVAHAELVGGLVRERGAGVEDEICVDVQQLARFHQPLARVVVHGFAGDDDAGTSCEDRGPGVDAIGSRLQSPRGVGSTRGVR